jgi:nucleoside-diphosphate-sugar epimerase
MRALIAGCGYVGLELGRELVRHGHQVCGLRRSDTAESALRGAGLVPLAADITRPDTLNTISAEFDWVVCCASATGGGPERYREVYVNGLRNLAAWLAVRPLQKFVYTSSTSVYAQTDGAVVDETSATEPAEETGQILLEAEHHLLAAARDREFPAVILRSAGIYGPGRGYWLRQFLSGEARLEAQGERVLNMVHRDDVVGAIIAALQLGRRGEIYNLVDDEPVTQLACFEWLSQKLARPLPPSPPFHGPERAKRGSTSKRVSNRKLKIELRYRFKYPTFREGFASELERERKESV